MTESTPDSASSGGTQKSRSGSSATGSSARKKPAAKKRAAKKPAAAQESTAVESAAPAEADVVATPDPEPAPAESAPAAAGQSPREAGSRSVLDRVRDNQVGPLATALVVAIAVGLLLSVLVPSEPSALAMILLGALLSAAVGFTVRYLSRERGWAAQAQGLLATVVGVHLMSVTGAVDIDLPLLSQVGVSGPGFDEALLVAFATPPVSTGALVAGLAAVVIVGWGRRRS